MADHPEPVATTWSLSFQLIEEKMPAAADLLRLCAFLSPDAIAEEILTAGASSLGSVLAPVAANTFLLNQAIEALRAYSLVRRDPKEKTLSIHRLVQAVLQDSLEKKERRIWANWAVLSINAAFPRVELRNWAQCERLLSQALLAMHIIERYQIIGEEAGRLLHETAFYLRSRARYVEAEPLFQRALHIKELHLGPEHPQVASSLTGLAILYNEQGKYVEAEPLFRRARQIWEQYPESEYPQATSPLQNLGNLYRWQGKFVEAEQHYQRALHLREKHLGPKHLSVARTLNGLANLYREQGKYAEAEQFYLRALQIRKQHLGSEHHETAETVHGLAQLREAQGNSEEARAWYARALAIRGQTLGGHHPKTTETRKHLIALLHAMGQHEEATRLEVVQSES